MTEGTVTIQGKRYPRSEAAKIELWVELVSALLETGDCAEDLKDATSELGREAQAQYPQLESGDPVKLSVPAAINGLFPDPIGTAFLVTTGEVLFACVDGPNAGMVTLCEVIDDLATTTKGGER